MKSRSSRLLLLAGVAVAVLLVVLLIATAPDHPAARIRVVDAAGKPVAGAVIHPEGMRTKPGPYSSGWYGWRADYHGVPNPPVESDEDGYAVIPYPKYVFERIETGTLCLSVDHPDYVPDRPERIVSMALPSGAPLQVRLKNLWDRARHKALLAHPDPIVLHKGAVLSVKVATDIAYLSSSRLFVQASGLSANDSGSWIRPQPGVILTRRLAEGSHTVRAVVLDSDGAAWFSDVIPITATIGKTNELELSLKPGAVARGRLDDSVPRPVTNGRVIAHVWPQGSKAEEDPPDWHTWASIQEDGSFELHSLPAGDLEIVALCNGYVSTNGPGRFGSRYPQKHVLGTNDLAVTVGMEPTARLEVSVMDDTGRPLKDVRVSTWPNVRYGEWSSTILASDCYNTSDLLLADPEQRNRSWEPVQDLQGISDESGLAVLPNLPADVTELAVDHPEYVLPYVASPDGRKHRQATFTLIAGQTNRLTIQLQPQEQSRITHY